MIEMFGHKFREINDDDREGLSELKDGDLIAFVVDNGDEFNIKEFPDVTTLVYRPSTGHLYVQDYDGVEHDYHVNPVSNCECYS